MSDITLRLDQTVIGNVTWVDASNNAYAAPAGAAASSSDAAIFTAVLVNPNHVLVTPVSEGTGTVEVTGSGITTVFTATVTVTAPNPPPPGPTVCEVVWNVPAPA